MKGKKFYIILIGLIIIGIGSVFVHRQQQEARFLEFEGYEIVDIEDRVAALYNEDKTDLADDFSEEELEELEVTLSDLQEKDLGRQNTNRIETMQGELSDASGMFTLEESIMNLFIEDEVIDKDTSVNDVEKLEQEVTDYEGRIVYYDRNLNRLDEARQQVEVVRTATEFVEAFFTEEDDIREDVTREEEAEALKLIDQVKNEEVKEELTRQIETVNLALTKREELEALEEEELTEEEAEEDEKNLETEENTEEDLEDESELEETEEVEEPEYTAPPNTGNTGSSNSSRTESSSNGSRSSERPNNNSPSNSNDLPESEEPESSNPIVEYRTNTVDESISKPSRAVTENPNWEVGREVIVTSGQEGLRRTTYRTPIYQDGSEGNTETVSTEVIEEPSPDVVQVGTKEPVPEEEQ